MSLSPFIPSDGFISDTKMQHLFWTLFLSDIFASMIHDVDRERQGKCIPLLARYMNGMRVGFLRKQPSVKSALGLRVILEQKVWASRETLIFDPRSRMCDTTCYWKREGEGLNHYPINVNTVMIVLAGASTPTSYAGYPLDNLIYDTQVFFLN